MQDHVNHARLGQRLAALMSRAVRDVAVEGLDPVVRLFDLVGRRWLLGAGTPPAGFGEDGFVLCVAGSEHLLERWLAIRAARFGRGGFRARLGYR